MLKYFIEYDIYTATVVHKFEIIEEGVLFETKPFSPYETFVKKLTNNGRITENSL